MSKLRKSARWAPHCFSCGLENPGGGALCLAHANTQSSGKGMGIKGRDGAGAILCLGCHNVVDGRVGGLDREAQQGMHHRAHLKTMEWWISAGYIEAGKEAI